MNDCDDDPLVYFQGDELPAWEGHIRLNGVEPNLSIGWTFTVTLTRSGQDPVVVTTGITGQTGGLFTVAWQAGTLDIEPGSWFGQITGRRDDGAEFTENQPIKIRPRALAET